MTDKYIKIPIWLATILTAAVLAIAGDTWRTVYQVKTDLLCLTAALEAKGVISGGNDHEKKEAGTNRLAVQQTAEKTDAADACSSKRPRFEADGWPAETAKMSPLVGIADNPAIQTGKKDEDFY